MATCPICGTEFRSRSATQKTCSHACRDSLQRGVVRGHRQPIEITCGQCGRPTLRKKRGALCSDCLHPARQCSVCGTAFRLRTPSSKATVCSLSCRGKAGIAKRGPFPTGRKHWLWKEGHAFYRGPGWTKLSKAIRARDDYTCQMCGRQAPDVLLDVHHAKPAEDWAEPGDANDPAHLVTLCDDCHQLEHRGVSGQTPESRRAYRRAYYQKHRAALIAASVNWQREHPQRRREINRAYYEREQRRRASEAAAR